MQQPLASASRWEAFVVGEPGNARAYNDVMETAARYSNAPGMDEAVTAGAHLYGAAQMSYVSGTLADAYTKAGDVSGATRTLFRLVAGSSWLVTPPQEGPT